MPYLYTIITWNHPKVNSRNELRKYVVLKFMEEEPGNGTGDLTSRYKYIVEEFKDRRKLYLKRPAQFKFGFDFQIWVENWNSDSKDKMPSYDDIIQDLKLKEEENSHSFSILLKSIDKIFICEDDNHILNWLYKKKVNFSLGEQYIIILKVLKWMFIEQDIRYWNFSGRTKLKKAISENFK